ncbi:MAG: glycosyltransferase family 39 protein [Castellaniella sp.]|uniref:glycosyltransferase family 39 protein n=1 Tax=Castellaniella sp. TaxID=1955812 RepID=UPI002A365E42|nr:glycosyltransferase family 39 protein [Castellaniella sp.]MDY0309164.1 glycosyltransferase family 39 protein [Castellaniella sp.]
MRLAVPPKIPLLARPPGTALVLLCLLGMVALWTVLSALSHSAPDLDGMEELVWAASLELGYTKHPPLPSWFMHLATELLGRPVWLPFLMGQVFSALGLWFVWKLGRDITTPHRALIATLLVSVTAYFSLRGTIYNHNTAQLWSITASIWLFHRALRGGRMRDWIWLGAVGGLSMLTKYSALIQFAAFFLYALRCGALRRPDVWRGIAVATVVFLIVLSPHLWWLGQHDFEPLRYADSSLAAGGRLAALKDLLDFSLDQAGRLSPMVLALAAWALWRKRRGDRAAGHAANDERFAGAARSVRYWFDLDAQDRQFLLWVGLAPFCSTVLISMVLGSRLEASWGSTFFVLFGFYGLGWLRGPEAVQLRRILILTAALHVLMAVGYAAARGPLAQWAGHPARSTYPGPELAAHALRHWQDHQPGRPLRVVVSNTWLGGNIAVHIGPGTRVWIDANDAQSPWFSPGTALRCGALIAYSEQGRAAPAPAVQALYDAAPWKGVDEVPWSGPKGKTIDLHWAVLPATPDCLQRNQETAQAEPPSGRRSVPLASSGAKSMGGSGLANK